MVGEQKEEVDEHSQQETTLKKENDADVIDFVEETEETEEYLTEESQETPDAETPTEEENPGIRPQNQASISFSMGLGKRNPSSRPGQICQIGRGSFGSRTRESVQGICPPGKYGLGLCISDRYGSGQKALNT